MKTKWENKWELSEPNINSAKRDNADGICAMGNCTNKLGNPTATAFMGLKVCNKCRNSMDKFLADTQKNIDEDMFSMIDGLIGNKTTEGNEMNTNSICCGKSLVKSNNKYFGIWMCEECNQLFDKAFNGEFLATGIDSTKEEQKHTTELAKALSIKLGHNGLFNEDNDINQTEETANEYVKRKMLEKSFTPIKPLDLDKPTEGNENV